MIHKKQLVAVEKMVGAAAKKKKPRLSIEAYRLIILLILAMLIIAACSNPIGNREIIDSVKNVAVEAIEETGNIAAEVVESDDQTAENQGIETQADKIETPVEEPTVGAEAAAAPETPTADASSNAAETPDIKEWRAAAETVGVAPEAIISVLDNSTAYVIETVDNETVAIVLTTTPDGIVSNEISLSDAISAASFLSTPENKLETPTALEVAKTENGDTMVYGVVRDSSVDGGKVRVVAKKVSTNKFERVVWQTASEVDGTPDSAATQETDEDATEDATQEASSNNGIVDYSETNRESTAENSTNTTNESIETQPVETEESPAATTENAELSLEAAQTFNPNVERIASGGTQYGFDSNGGLAAVFNQETNSWGPLELSIDQIEDVSSSKPDWNNRFSINATVGKLYIPENGKDLGNGNTSLVMVDVLTVLDGKIQVGQISLVTRNQPGEFMVGHSIWPANFDAWQPEHWLGLIAKVYYALHIDDEVSSVLLYDDIDIRAGEGIDAYILDYFNPDRNMPRITPGDKFILSFKPAGVELPKNPETETAKISPVDYYVYHQFWGLDDDPRINELMDRVDFSIFDENNGEIPTLPSYIVEFYEDKDHQK